MALGQMEMLRSMPGNADLCLSLTLSQIDQNWGIVFTVCAF